MSLSEQGIRVGLGDMRSVVAGSVLALMTAPTVDLSPDKLSASAAELVELACRRWLP